MLKSLPSSVYLICKRVVAVLISYDEVILQQGRPLTQWDLCPYEKLAMGRKGDTGRMPCEDRIGVMHL